MGDLGRDSRSLRRDGRWGMGLVGRIERARALFERGLVVVRRCELFGRMLWGGLVMVAVVIWMLERGMGMCLIWAKVDMDWQGSSRR